MSQVIRYIVLLGLLIYCGVTTLAQNTLFDLISDTTCTTSCWLGVEPGLTTEVQLETILINNNISFERTELGTTGNVYSYEITGGYSHPLVTGNSILIFTNQSVVVSINMLLSNVQINDILNEFGEPSDVLTNISNVLLYEIENIAFGVIDDNRDFAFNLLIMSEQVESLAYTNNPRYESSEPCSDGSQFCSIVETVICDTNIALSDISALTSAIATANGAGEAYTICLENSTYTLTSADNSNSSGANGLPVITGDVTIVGNGASITRDGSAPTFRVFEVASTGQLTLQDVTVSGGNAGSFDGGAVLVNGALTLNNATITQNTALNGGGIAVASNASLTANNSLISMNTASFSGGGIATLTGTVTLSNTSVDNNLILAHE